jgi:hypothetical protein
MSQTDYLTKDSLLPEGQRFVCLSFLTPSDSYILYKFCELLELDDLLEFFPLLKSPQKLMEQDYVWKKFCKYLKWEFYPTRR